MIYVCEYCNQIKEAPDKEEREKIDLSDIESIADAIGDPTPHYICPDCVRRVKMMDKITTTHVIRTVRDIFEEMSDAEKEVVYAMVGQTLTSGKVDFDVLGDIARSIYRGFTEEQLKVVNAILAEAMR